MGQIPFYMPRSERVKNGWADSQLSDLLHRTPFLSCLLQPRLDPRKQPVQEAAAQPLHSWHPVSAAPLGASACVSEAWL